MRFTCTLVQRIYQDVEVEAANWQEAEQIAIEQFDGMYSPEMVDIEVYDTVEVTT